MSLSKCRSADILPQISQKDDDLLSVRPEKGRSCPGVLEGGAGGVRGGGGLPGRPLRGCGAGGATCSGDAPGVREGAELPLASLEPTQELAFVIVSQGWYFLNSHEAITRSK